MDHDMKSHMMSIKKLSIYSSPNEHGSNIKIFTDANLVGNNLLMLQILYTKYLLEAQYYRVKDSMLYQDIQTLMMLGVNGKRSNGKCTLHINI